MTVLVVALAALSLAADPPGADAIARLRVRLPRPFVERPATVPGDHFEVRFTGALRTDRDGNWSAPLAAGAGYGFNDDIELGVELLRLTLTPATNTEDDGELLAPGVYGAGKLTLQNLDLGARLDVEVPLQGFRASDATLFGRLRIARRVRLDLAWKTGVFVREGRAEWPSQLPIDVAVQLTPDWALSAGGTFVSDDLWRSADLRFVSRTGLVWTVGNRRTPPLVDLKAALVFPSVRIRGEGVREDWGFTVSGFLYFDDPSNAPSSDLF